MIAISRSSLSILAGLLVGSTVIAIVQNAWYWQQLPARVATHFGFDGEPNAWMSRDAATAMLLTLQRIGRRKRGDFIICFDLP